MEVAEPIVKQARHRAAGVLLRIVHLAGASKALAGLQLWAGVSGWVSTWVLGVKTLLPVSG